MAERAIQDYQYAYANNASQVLEADRDRRREKNVPSGAAESLAGRTLPKMGDRAIMVTRKSERGENSKDQKKRERHSNESSNSKKRKVSGITINSRVNNVLTAVDEYSSHIYRPKTAETEVKYAELLALISKYYPDESGDIIADIANEVLTILKGEEVRGKQERVEAVLARMDERTFGNLMSLSKEITDFDVDLTRASEKEEIVTLDMDMESDEQMLDEIVSEEEESEGEDVAQTNALTTVGASMEEEAGSDSLRIEAIDSYWLQRQIGEYEKDAVKSQAIAEQIVAILMSDDERENESRLVELVGMDHPELISLLLTNGKTIAYVTRWRQAQNESEKEAIAQEMLKDESIDGVAVIEALEGKGGSMEGLRGTEYPMQGLRGVESHMQGLRGTEYPMQRLREGTEHRRMKAHTEKEDEEALREEEKLGLSLEMHVPKPRAQLSLSDLAFAAGGHLMSKKSFRLPEGSYKVPKPGYEEVHVPAIPNKYSDTAFINSQHIVTVEEMPEWFHAGFEGVKKLNLVQSRVYESAMLSSENLLLCAPTGAGKTNVALMTILHEMWLHRREDGSVDKDKFKIVYVAPMKALVKEMVDNFGKKLKPYGMKVRELSGDVNLTKEEIAETQLIITTPEKWDIITRKSGDRTYTQLVRLIIIDEIHLLHDDRGPVLESLVARTVRQVEMTQEMVRLVGLSATFPNYQDVAAFLRVDPAKGLFNFDSSYRPVGLEQQFIGITEKSSFKSMKLMNEVCYEKVMDKAGKKQVLVFVHSRKETAKTAQYLMDRAVEQDEHHRFFSSEVARKELEDEIKKYTIKNEELKKLLPGGFAIHHAGLCRSDRTAVEELFGRGLIQVLVSTMTLAWGVNLPAHTVIIKGTQMYSPEKSAWVELSPQDVLQMLGRAGRPQFEKCGEGIIITKSSELQYYLSLMNAQLPIESQFIKKLADNMNAEIVMGTITTLEEAVSWLGYTYLYVRLLKNPSLYGCDPALLHTDPTLLQYRVDLVHAAAVLLAKNALIKYDVKTGLFESTGLGRIASYYYISNNSISVYNEHMKPSMNDIELFRLFSMSNEFAQITVRPEEKLELDMLMKRVPIPIRETVENPISKVNVLLQSYISRVRLEKFALACDMVYITQSAGRILRALFEIALLKGWSALTQRCLELCKMVSHQQWSIQSPLRQFGKLPATVLKRLENKPISFERYYDMTPPDFEELASTRDHQVRDVGVKIDKLVHELPRLSAEATILPITRTMISIELALTADFTYNSAIHGSSQGFHILIEDSDGESILYYQYWLLKEKYADETQHISFTVPLFDPLPPQYFLRIISDTWLQAESTHLISLRSLVLPEKFPPHTELLDLQPLSLQSLKNPVYETLFQSTLTQFNSIQTQVFSAVYESDQNILLAARSGSGKGVVAELAMMRLFSQNAGKVLYLCAIPEVCERKFQRWTQLFGEGLGKKVGQFVGDSKQDTRTLSECDIVLSLPEHVDYFTNKGLHLKLLQRVQLVLVDKLHLLNSAKGHYLEIVLSRLRAMEAQAKADPEARYHLHFRYVALSACLANARSLAGWLNVDKGLFSFHSSVKVNPLQIRVDSFDINHAGTRLLAMSKPVYTSITGLANGNNTLVFVPSRKQAQMTAIDILTFVSTTTKPKRFNHIPEEELQSVLSHVVDPALKTVLEGGIGYYYKGMNESDARLVMELFKNDYIQILVTPYDLCWTLDLSVYLVIIMDTCYYDGKEHRYLDYSIYELLQMIGLASRAGKYPSGKAVVMTHVSKKAYLNKFLFEPLPIESTLHDNLGDALNAAIVSRTVNSMQDAVEWLTWFYFYRRLPQNPNYYSLAGVSDEQLSEFVSVLTENTVDELVRAGLVEQHEDGSLTSLNLGILSTHLFIKYQTTELFALSITSKTKRRGLLQILSSATEFEDIPLRQHEQLQLSRMEKHLSYVVEKGTLSARKVNILLQAYFSREAISKDMRMDTLGLLPTALRLLHGMVNVCSTNSWLKPAIASIELCQMIVQGAWNEDSRLLQLPHFDKERSRLFESEGVDNIFDFLDMEDEVRKGLLEGLSEKEVEAIVEYCNAYPDIEVKPRVQETMGVEEESVLEVELVGGEEEDGFDTKVRSASYPQELNATWWLILGDPAEGTIYSISEVDLERTNKKVLQFTAPSTPGHYKWMLYFMTDGYIGCDQEQEIEFDVLERN